MAERPLVSVRGFSASHSVLSNSATPWTVACPGSSVHGILQARILEWVATPFPRGSSWPRDQTWASGIAGRFFTIWVSTVVLIEKYLVWGRVWLASSCSSWGWLFVPGQHGSLRLGSQQKKEYSQVRLWGEGLLSYSISRKNWRPYHFLRWGRSYRLASCKIIGQDWF